MFNILHAKDDRQSYNTDPTSNLLTISMYSNCKTDKTTAFEDVDS